MKNRTEPGARLWLSWALTFALLWKGTTTATLLYSVSNQCFGSDKELCGCQAVPKSEIAALQDYFGQTLSCVDLCSQTTCSQTCEESVCVTGMGPDDIPCGAVVEQSYVDFVRSASCSFNREMQTYECTTGRSVAYPDAQTYEAIVSGYCIPICDLDMSGKCTFPGTFRPETLIYGSDSYSAPFTVITDVDFKHMEAVETVSVTLASAPSSECGDSRAELCGCQIVPKGDLEDLEKFFKEELVCDDYCSQTSCYQTCTLSGCVHEMGFDGQLCVGLVDQSLVDLVREATCSDSEIRRLKKCVVGNSVFYPDEQTYEAVTDGYCVPVCDLDLRQVCKFDGYYREDISSFASDDVPSAPFTVISDETFKHLETVVVVPPPPSPVPIYQPKPSPSPSPVPRPSPSPSPVPRPVPSPSPVPEPSPKPVPSPSPVPRPSPSPSPVPRPVPSPSPVPEPSPKPVPSPSPVPRPSPSPSPVPRPVPSPSPVIKPFPSPSPVPGKPEPEQEPERIEVTTLSTTETAPEEAKEAEPAEPTKESPVEPLRPSPRPPPPSPSPPPPPPVAPPKPLPESRYYLLYSSFGECSQVCSEAGDSFRERYPICQDYDGFPVPLRKCELPSNIKEKFYKECEPDRCGPGYYVKLTDWGACPKDCAGVMSDGTVIPNQMTRDYECYRSSDGAQVDKAACSSILKALGVRLSMQCNSSPCAHLGYDVTDWKTCSCDDWTQTRSATCIKLESGAEVPGSECKAYSLTSPTKERSCFRNSCFEKPPTRRLLAEDYCDYTSCSGGNGECENGGCVCEDGFEGPDCQEDGRDNWTCPLPSLFGKNGRCCLSGIFDFDGKCCPGNNWDTHLDIGGRCCSGMPLNGCGQCSENVRHIDVSGKCCKFLDAAGACCASGAVDECGVCDGNGASCKTLVQFEVELGSDAQLDACIRELEGATSSALGVAADSLDVKVLDSGEIRFTEKDLAMTSGLALYKVRKALRSSSTRSCTVSDVMTDKRPICGNGICEIGEYDDCPKDCLMPIKRCGMQRGLFNEPVVCNGHGICSMVGEAACECFVGYAGDSCGKCADGFFAVESDKRCIPIEAFTNRPGAKSNGMERPTIPFGWAT